MEGIIIGTSLMKALSTELYYTNRKQNIQNNSRWPRQDQRRENKQNKDKHNNKRNQNRTQSRLGGWDGQPLFPRSPLLLASSPAPPRRRARQGGTGASPGVQPFSFPHPHCCFTPFYRSRGRRRHRLQGCGGVTPLSAVARSFACSFGRPDPSSSVRNAIHI